MFYKPEFMEVKKEKTGNEWKEFNCLKSAVLFATTRIAFIIIIVIIFDKENRCLRGLSCVY